MKYNSTELINGLLIGERDVLEFIYSYFETVLTHFIYKNSGNKSDVPDLMQETLLVIYERVKKNVEINDFGAFFYTVARNKWIAKQKPINKWCFVEDLDSEEYRIENKSKNVEDQIISDDSLGLLKEIWTDVIGKVNPRCEIILINEFYTKPKLSGEQLAKLLNTSHGTVRNAKCHCLEKLRKHIRRHPKFEQLRSDS